MAEQVRGRDVSAPIKHFNFEGAQYPLVFNNMAARIAEDVYEQVYGKDVGYQYILQALARCKYSAVMAMLYGALRAGGADMEWAAFDQAFKLVHLDGVKEILEAGVIQSLPTEDETGTDAENPTPTPTES